MVRLRFKVEDGATVLRRICNIPLSVSATVGHLPQPWRAGFAGMLLLHSDSCGCALPNVDVIDAMDQ